MGNKMKDTGEFVCMWFFGFLFVMFILFFLLGCFGLLIDFVMWDRGYSNFLNKYLEDGVIVRIVTSIVFVFCGWFSWIVNKE